MKASIETSILIDASPEKVWNTLTDFNSYPAWNPFVQRLEGNVKEGNKIKIQLPGMKFKPTVLTFAKNKKFEWLGNFLFKGIFDGNHIFELMEKEHQTLFIHRENFSGILVKMLLKKVGKETEEGFKKMNEALKQRVENN